METELRDLLRDRADSLPAPAALPAPILRRARRRRWASGALAAVTAAVLVTGSVVGVQAALSHQSHHHTVPVVQPTTPSTPTPSPSEPGPAPYGDLAQAMWPAATPDQFVTLEKDLAAGKQTFGLQPEEEAVAFADAVLGWSATDIATHSTSVSGNDATVVLWNRRMADSFDPSIAETITMQRFRPILGPPNPVWLVSGASSGLIVLASPSPQQVLWRDAPVEVTGSVTQRPAGWSLVSILGYSDSLIRKSAGESTNDLRLKGQGFDVTLMPRDSYSPGTTLSLRLVSGDGSTLGLYARKFSTPPFPSPSSPTTETGVFGVMLTTIQAASPPHWSFDLTPDRLDGDWNLDGTVDDGSGPGRLLVNITATPGKLEAHPCSDSEFAQGASCVEQPGPNGSLLVLRGVLDQGGNETIEAVLIRPDRSGIGAEAGNWIISGSSGNSGGGSNEQVTRTHPVYTVEQLGKLVAAVAEKVFPCIEAGC